MMLIEITEDERKFLEHVLGLELIIANRVFYPDPICMPFKDLEALAEKFKDIDE